MYCTVCRYILYDGSSRTCIDHVAHYVKKENMQHYVDMARQHRNTLPVNVATENAMDTPQQSSKRLLPDRANRLC